MTIPTHCGRCKQAFAPYDGVTPISGAVTDYSLYEFVGHHVEHWSASGREEPIGLAHDDQDGCHLALRRAEVEDNRKALERIADRIEAALGRLAP